MLSRSVTSLSFALLVTFSPTSLAAVSLIDALYANGASQFAIALLSNQSLLDLYQSPNVQTVFAPIDGYVSNNTGNLRRDAAGEAAALYDYQVSSDAVQMVNRARPKKKRAVELFGDQVVEMELEAEKLLPNNQSIVAEIALLSSVARVKLRRGAGGSSPPDHYSADQKPSVPAYSAPPKNPPPDSPTPKSPPEKTYTETKTKEQPPPPPDTIKTTTTVVEKPPPPNTVKTTATVIEKPPPPPPDTIKTTTTVVEKPPPPNTVKTTTTVIEQPPPPTKEITIVTTATEIIYPPPVTRTTLITRTTTEVPLPLTEVVTRVTTATQVIQPTPTTRITVLTRTTTEIPPPPIEVITQTFTATEVVLAPPITSTTTTTQLTVVSQGTTTIQTVTLTLTSVAQLPPVTIPTTTSTTTTSTAAASGVIPNPPIKLASGLGNKVNLLRADIPYDGGLLQITDGYFTIPQPVSYTLNYTNLTGFLSLLNQVNLTTTVDNFHRITIFVPSNAAIAEIRSSLASPAQIQTFVFSHIIPGFLGYLPRLNNITSLPTLANTTITVRRQNNIYLLNGARIIDSDILTDNGVIHEINQTLTRALVPFTGDAAPMQKSTTVIMAVVLFALAAWVY